MSDIWKRVNALMTDITSLNKTDEPHCVFWCITNLILGMSHLLRHTWAGDKCRRYCVQLHAPLVTQIVL
jgi:hypothetical protein